MLEARAIRVRRGRQLLLDGVSLVVEPGKICAVVGANGAGKSTLLKVLCGDLHPTAGQILLEGRALSTWKRQDCARQRAVLPQEARLDFPFTAREVVALGRSPHCGTAGERADRRIIAEALEAADVAHLAERLYPSLSGGERQRVQLARVLAQIWEPPQAGARYLLLDEPTASLDLEHQHALLAVARAFAAQGTGVVAVLHDLNLAAQYADTLLLLKQGRLIASGPAHQVLVPQTIQQAFLVESIVVPHPRLPCPLVIPMPPPPALAIPTTNQPPQ